LFSLRFSSFTWSIPLVNPARIYSIVQMNSLTCILPPPPSVNILFHFSMCIVFYMHLYRV
jgi:hypothetical protein